MRKRLRKKRRLGEFREDAFEVFYSLRESVTTDEAEEFLWRFLENAIEANGLACGGGGGTGEWSFVVQLAGRGSPEAEQRQAVGTWLSEQQEVLRSRIGPPFDAWRGPEPGEEQKVEAALGPVGVAEQAHEADSRQVT